jgi:hypothetical protein
LRGTEWTAAQLRAEARVGKWTWQCRSNGLGALQGQLEGNCCQATTSIKWYNYDKLNKGKVNCVRCYKRHWREKKAAAAAAAAAQ